MLQRAQGRGRHDDSIEALHSRFQFYIESVQPSIDAIKERVGASKIAIIDAHQPHYEADSKTGKPLFHLQKSILNIVIASLRSLGVPRTIIRDILATHYKL